MKVFLINLTYLIYLSTVIISCKQKPEEEPFVKPENLNFASHIAPIVHQTCSPCHRKDGAGPFELIQYADFAKRHKDIKHVINNHIMPPWKADPNYVSYKNERLLQPNQIKLISAWIDDGLNRGNDKISDDPFLDTISDQPDLILKLEKPNMISGNNSETFLLNYIPFEIDSARSVKSIEFVAGNKSKVHHCTYYFYEVSDQALLKGDNGPFNVDVTEKHTEEVKSRYKELTKSMSFYAGWIPGAGPVSFSEEMGFMPKKGMLMMTLHYAPSPVPDTDSSYLKIYYHKKPIKRQVYNVTLGTGGLGFIDPPIILRPETTSRHRVVLPIDQDISLISVWPHMHYLGKNIRAYALTPQKDTIRLVRINEWDFYWQEIYYFKNLVKVPKGSKIFVEATFDNSSENIHNPFNPPRMVISKGNMATTDEMLTLMLMYLEYKSGDEQVIL